MVTDAREPKRNYPIPSTDNRVSEEFPRIETMIIMVADDVDAVLTALAGKAALVHGHTIAQISGLQTALDLKANIGATYSLGGATDVNAAGAANYMALCYLNGVWRPLVINAANIDGLPAVIAGTAIDAGKITSGVLDPARIPVLASQNTIVSAGGIAALTSGQQANIGTGTHVTTTDGRRWVYSGSGSKTVEASYIELGDVTPEWAVIANKPGLVASLAALAVAAGDLIIGAGAGALGRLAIGEGYLKASGGTLSWVALDNIWFPGSIRGLTISRASATTFSVSTGACRNDDGGQAYNMTLSSAMTKGLGAWAPGNGNGSLDTGAIAPNSCYHVHQIRKDTDGTLDHITSLSPTTPLVPAGYTARRRIGAILTDSSSQIRTFTQIGDRFILAASILDAFGSISSTSQQLIGLSVPTGINVEADFGVVPAAAAVVILYVSSPLQNDEAPSETAAPLYSNVSGGAAGRIPGRFKLMTDQSGRVRTRNGGTTSITMNIATYGWLDTRGKN